MMNISIMSQLCRHMVSEEYFLSIFFFLFCIMVSMETSTNEQRVKIYG